MPCARSTPTRSAGASLSVIRMSTSPSGTTRERTHAELAAIRAERRHRSALAAIARFTWISSGLGSVMPSVAVIPVALRKQVVALMLRK